MLVMIIWIEYQENGKIHFGSIIVYYSADSKYTIVKRGSNNNKITAKYTCGNNSNPSRLLCTHNLNIYLENIQVAREGNC